MTSKFDKPYRNVYKVDSKKISELFSIAGNMISEDIKKFSLIYKVPLHVADSSGNNLIHKIFWCIRTSYIFSR